MKIPTVIYSRVSTDEQAELGSSLADQVRKMRDYCVKHNLEIIAEYQDDCSAKTFERPAFQEFLMDIKSGRIKPKYFLVSRPDRFSRDIRNTLNMVEELKKYGVELRSCENNLNLDNADDYLPFVMYYTMPQVENMRRSENTINGMRQAKREGRWVGNAPRGYSYDRSGKHALLVPNDQAPLIVKAFELFSKQTLTVMELGKLLRKEGLKVYPKQLYNILRMKVYCGILEIEAWRDEEAETVIGVHEPLISIALFDEVQDILEGKKKPRIKNGKHDEILPLRRLIICADCGRPFTGSRSKGGSGNGHYYYHCQGKCNRHAAAQMNDRFLTYLQSFQPPEAFLRLYSESLSRVFRQSYKTNADKVKEIDKQIEEQKEKLDMAGDKLVEGTMDDDTYKRYQERTNEKINALLMQRTDINLSVSPIDEYLDSGITLLTNLPDFYINADVETKKLIVRSIFPENLIYDGEIYRTEKMNAFLAQMHSDFSTYRGSITAKAEISFSLSTVVAPTRIELVSKV